MRSRIVTAALALTLAFSGIIASPSGAGAASVSAASPSRRWVGFYQPGTPFTMEPFKQAEWTTRARGHVVSYFQLAPERFSPYLAGQARKHGVIPMITLEMGKPDYATAGSQPEYSMEAIIRGDWDAYLRQYARDAKAFGGEIWLRPFHEMNGDWYPWGGGKRNGVPLNGNTPASCAAGWRHVRQIFIDEGATNVKFVWSVNHLSIPNTAENAISKYWPGDTYVDIIGIDGFNFGSNYRYSKWTSFETLYAKTYAELSKLPSSKPIIVAETGCSTVGGDKAAWIESMFKVIPAKFPRIKGVVWFNVDKDRDWRVDSSSASRRAFVAGASGSQWINKTATSLSIKSSKTKTKRKRTFTLSGSLKAGKTGDEIRVDVMRPGSKSWKLVGKPKTSGTAWQYRIKPGYRGTYRFRVRYLGHFSRTTATSKTIKVIVK